MKNRGRQYSLSNLLHSISWQHENTDTRRASFRYEYAILFCILLLCFAIFWLVCFKWLTCTHVINNDERQQVMPYHTCHENGILEHSMIRKYMLAYNPIGHRIIYFLLTYVFSPFLAAKIISVILCSLLILYCYRIGKIVFPSAGLLLAILVLRGVTFSSIIGGLPRSFGVVLIFFFMYYFLTNNFIGIMIAFLLQAALYPSSLIVCTASYGIYLIIKLAYIGIMKVYRQMILTFLTIVLCFIILFPLLHKPETIGNAVTFKEASKMRVFGKGGRFGKVIPFNSALNDIRCLSNGAFQPIAYPFTSSVIVSSKGFQLMIFFWCSLGIGFLIITKKYEILLKIFCFLIGGTIMYFVARILAFRLFLPTRLIQYSWAYLAPVVCCIGLASAPNLRLGNKNICLRQVMFSLFLIGVYVVSPCQYKGKWNNFGFIDGSQKKDLYEFFTHCPADIMIAGDPHELDNVMSFSRRNAYVTFEASHPLYPPYYNEIARRYDCLHKGYFSTNIKELTDFICEESIDYLLVNQNHFKSNMGINYKLFEPFTSELNNKLQHIPSDTFVLNSAKIPGIVFISDPFVVIETRKFLLGKRHFDGL